MNNALFGHRLRTYRKEKGLTIEKLVEQVGLSPNYLGDVERGKKLPSMATFIRLVNVLDISADELLKDEVNRADRTGMNGFHACYFAYNPARNQIPLQ